MSKTYEEVMAMLTEPKTRHFICVVPYGPFDTGDVSTMSDIPDEGNWHWKPCKVTIKESH